MLARSSTTRAEPFMVEQIGGVDKKLSQTLHRLYYTLCWLLVYCISTMHIVVSWYLLRSMYCQGAIRLQFGFCDVSMILLSISCQLL